MTNEASLEVLKGQHEYTFHLINCKIKQDHKRRARHNKAVRRAANTRKKIRNGNSFPAMLVRSIRRLSEAYANTPSWLAAFMASSSLFASLFTILPPSLVGTIVMGMPFLLVAPIDLLRDHLTQAGRNRPEVAYAGADLTPEFTKTLRRLRHVAEEHGSWRTFGERLVYDNKWVKVGLTDVEAPNGARWEYHVVHLARIAIALIVNDQDEALMLWRYRFATEQWGYELLGGMVDEGEDAATTAAREAAEESGWEPVGEAEHLVSLEPLPGQVTAPMDIYLWRDAKHIGDPTDTEEVGRVEWVPLSRVTELAQRQELLGSGTLVALLYYMTSRKA